MAMDSTKTFGTDHFVGIEMLNFNAIHLKLIS